MIKPFPRLEMRRKKKRFHELCDPGCRPIPRKSEEVVVAHAHRARGAGLAAAHGDCGAISADFRAAAISDSFRKHGAYAPGGRLPACQPANLRSGRESIELDPGRVALP